jgi:hypothetical protein
MSEVKLMLKPTAGGSLYFDVTKVTFAVSHAFGQDARYKGRNQEMFLEIEPQNVQLHVSTGMDSSVSLGDVLAVIQGQVTSACEVVVTEALERERKEVERITNLAHGSTEAKSF